MFTMVSDPPTRSLPDHIGIHVAYRYRVKIATQLHKSGSEPKLVVRKDSKTKKAEQANLQLSKTFKIKRIGRENNSGACPERYRVRGGVPTDCDPQLYPNFVWRVMFDQFTIHPLEIRFK